MTDMPIIYKEVYGSELEAHTKSGWEVVERLHGDYTNIFHLNSQAAHPRAGAKREDGGYGNEPHHIDLARQELGKDSRYLLKRGTANDLIETLQRALDAAVISERDTHDELVKSDKAKEDTMRELTIVVTERDAYKQAVESSGRRADKLEADIARIHKAIGEDRMKEILKR